MIEPIGTSYDALAILALCSLGESEVRLHDAQVRLVSNRGLGDRGSW